MDRYNEEKKLAAKESIGYVGCGMAIGLGTGSTATYFIQELADAVKNGRLRNISCVATSRKTSEMAQNLGLKILELNQVTQLDLTVDGADEFDPDLNLIKGGGGALIREKIVASISNKMIVIADSGKQVETLGRFKLPVEVFPFCHKPMLYELDRLGYNPGLRLNADGSIFVTDNTNYIIDLSLGKIPDPYPIQTSLDNIPGIVGHGLFLDYADVILMGNGQTVKRIIRKGEPEKDLN